MSPGIEYVIGNEYIRYGVQEAILSIEARVLGRDLPSKEVTVNEIVFFEHPASPFQHWKMRHKDSWWLGWFVRQWPVIIAQHAKGFTLTATWDMNLVFPEQEKAKYQGLGKEYLVVEEPRSWLDEYSPGSITCPKCGKASYHPKDIEQRYCGACHMYHADWELYHKQWEATDLRHGDETSP